MEDEHVLPDLNSDIYLALRFDGLCLAFGAFSSCPE